VLHEGFALDDQSMTSGSLNFTKIKKIHEIIITQYAAGSPILKMHSGQQRGSVDIRHAVGPEIIPE